MKIFNGQIDGQMKPQKNAIALRKHSELRSLQFLDCKLISYENLARLYPFEIEVILDAAWVPLSSSPFQTSPHTTDIEKSQEHILKYQNYQWQRVLEFG